MATISSKTQKLYNVSPYFFSPEKSKLSQIPSPKANIKIWVGGSLSPTGFLLLKTQAADRENTNTSTILIRETHLINHKIYLAVPSWPVQSDRLICNIKVNHTVTSTLHISTKWVYYSSCRSLMITNNLRNYLLHTVFCLKTSILFKWVL